MQGKERPRKEANHLRLVGGRFDKQGNLHMRLFLSDKMSTSPHPPARVLKVYIEALTRFSHVYSPDGLNNTLLSQGCVPREASGRGEGKWKPHSKDGGGSEELPIVRVQLTGQLAVASS